MIDRDLLIEVTPEKIKAEDIEGTFYRSTTLGGGAFRVGLTEQSATTSGSVASGSTYTVTVTFTLGIPIITIPQIMFSIYVDNDNDTTWQWPNGSNLTSANRPRVNWGLNEGTSDPANGIYKYNFSIKNESVGAQTFYFKIRALLPLNTG